MTTMTASAPSAPSGDSLRLLSLEHRPELDGLRGIAVLVVVLFHLGLSCPGGFVGVDVFFVLSGFLITALMLRDMQSGRFTLAGFWERRIRRIFPALAVVLVASTLFAGFWLLPGDYATMGRSLIAQPLLVANFFFAWQAGDYFGQVESHPLLHTWSLAVEEQFYVIFPLVLMLLFRFGARRRLSVLLGAQAAGFLASLLLAVALLPERPTATFYLLPTRAWELLGGSLLATLPVAAFSARRWLREIVSWVGLIGLLLPVWLYSEGMPFPGWAALPPCLGTMAVIWANAPLPGISTGPTTSARLLTLRPLVFVGLISYSFYLVHWPVIVFYQYGIAPLTEHPWPVQLALFAVCLGLAIASWKFVETPFRTRRLAGTRRAVFAFAAASVTLSLVLGGIIVATRGMRMRFERAGGAVILRNDEARSDRGFSGNVGLSELKKGQTVRFGVPDPAAPPVVLLWGDSHARGAIVALDELCRQKGVAGEAIVYSATPPLIDTAFITKSGLNESAPRWADMVVERIKERKIKHVVLAAYWSARTEENAAQLEAGLKKTFARLQELGCTVWVLMDAPDQQVTAPRTLARVALTGGTPARWARTVADHRARNALIYRLAAQGGGVTFIDPAPLFLEPDQQTYRLADEGVALYYDRHHLTARAARRYLSRALEPTLGRALAQP